LKAVAPVHGVSFGRLHDKSTWIIAFDESATDEQRETAEAVMAGFELREAEPLPDPLLQRIAALESKVNALDTSIEVLAK